jgi:peptidyl-prolyl cis-trans isomerase SurA
MPKGSFEPFLKSHGIELSTVREQVRAEIAWQEVVSREVSPEAHVPEEAVTERLETLKDNLGKPEYLVSEIFLPVEHPRDDAEVRSFGERLIEQMRQGAPFAQLALQFSATGAGGGNLGWVSDGMIDPVLLEALARVPVNAVTSPVRTADGYHLLLLNAKRQVGDGYSRGPQAELLTIDLTSLPSSNQADRAAQLARLKSVLAPAKNCDDLERLTKQVPSATFNPRSKVAMRGLPANIRALAENLEPGQISDAVESDANTVRVVAVCQRFPDTGGLPAREDVRRQMENERIDLQARRFLRELKREAYIEVRI